MRNASYAAVHDKYALDLFDPHTWYRGVFGEGTKETDIGLGGCSGLSRPTKEAAQVRGKKRGLFEAFPGYHWV